MKCSQGDFQLRKLLLQEFVDLQVWPIGRNKQQPTNQQQASVIINYDNSTNDKSNGQLTDVKYVSLEDLMTWDILIKVPYYHQ